MVTNNVTFRRLNMKKNERLIAELYFINQKKYFNLSDLMDTFNISKRTALRDIIDLESLGAPILIDKGRYGGYQVLQNKSLPPLYLNQNEWHALFLSIQLLRELNQSPFQHSYQDLKAKLLAISPKTEQDINEQLDNIVVISNLEGITPAPLLANLFQTIYDGQVIEIIYVRYEEDYRMIQPIQLIFKYGHWYLLAWDLEKNGFRHFRCDFIKEFEKKNHPQGIPNLLDRYVDDYAKNKPYTFKAKLKIEALDLFKLKKYQGIELVKEDGNYYITGLFDRKEIPFLMNYFLSFGTYLTLISPVFLVDAYKKKLDDIRNNYN